MSITSDHDGITESGRTVLAGSRVDYLGHVIGGMVRVRVDGREETMHPRCFPNFR